MGHRQRLQPGDDDVSVPQSDLVVRSGDGLGAGGAGAIERVGGDLFRELGKEAHFPPNVGNQRRGDYLAEDDLIHIVSIQVGALHQLARRVPGQVHAARVLQLRPGLAERRAVPRDDGDAPPPVRAWHYILLRLGTKPTIGPAAGPSSKGGWMEAPFSQATRASALVAMSTEPVDLLILGGGITGAGIARDAALRGIRTALVDKGDFGGATSSRSSRFIHGGLRYPEHGNLGPPFRGIA
jgi:hypothetical protein